jgi:hypothetical protein
MGWRLVRDRDSFGLGCCCCLRDGLILEMVVAAIDVEMLFAAFWAASWNARLDSSIAQRAVGMLSSQMTTEIVCLGFAKETDLRCQRHLGTIVTAGFRR